MLNIIKKIIVLVGLIILTVPINSIIHSVILLLGLSTPVIE
ncbi:hypothetical protein [Nitrosomonas sp. Is37]|nr:hypothetical protein [Nitrosomonas sp. Is37]MDV6343992.1 hypothetical protein [Nitrosomonas sp. Is37]